MYSSLNNHDNIDNNENIDNNDYNINNNLDDVNNLNNLNIKDEINKLENIWTLWLHLPHDTEWGMDSYKEIYKFDTLNDASSLIEYIQQDFITNCMIFLMKENIKPIWEDANNKNGGCISYKINNKVILDTWKKLCYSLICGNLLRDIDYYNKITGITLSPKKNFCIIKFWFSSIDKNIENICIFNNICDINNLEGIFRKHIE